MYQKRSFGFLDAITPAIKNILYANVLMFILTQYTAFGPRLENLFALSSYGVFEQFRIWQVVTYMFLHGGFWHIFFNMFILWMFGVELERNWGTREFVKFYFITGIGGAVLNLILSGEPTIGASAAVYGVMIAYALAYPDRLIYVYFLFPVKVKYLMGFLAVFSFFSTIGPNTSNIAHAAHLGGMIVGFVYLKYWKIHFMVKGFLQKTFGNLSSPKSRSSDLKYTSGSGGGENKTEFYRRKIDDLLDKINKVGYMNLSDEEKRMLDEGSRYLREHDKN